MPTILIVVPTRGRPRMLNRLLVSLAPQLRVYPNVRLVVVNDADDGPEYRRAIEDHNDVVDYRVRTRRAGNGGEVRWDAVADAMEDYILTTDDDCIAPKWFLETVISVVAAFPEADILVGKTRPLLESPTQRERAFSYLANTTPIPFYAYGHLVTAVGAASIFRREFYQKAGFIASSERGMPEDCHRTQKALRAGACHVTRSAFWLYHEPKHTFFEVARHFWSYGRGDMEYLIAEQDWITARLLFAGQSSVLRDMDDAARRTMAVARMAGEGRVVRFMAWAAAALSTFAYRLGSLTARTKIRNRTGRDLPDPPPLTDRFAGFVSAPVPTEWPDG